MGEKRMAFSPGFIFMPTEDGEYVPAVAVADMSSTKDTTHYSKIGCVPAEYQGIFHISESWRFARIRKVLLGWDRKAPIRLRQIMRTIKMRTN